MTVVLAAMRAEARALRRGGTLPVLRTGTGPRRAARAAARLAGRRVVVAGIGGGLAAVLDTGAVVVADAVRCAEGGAPIAVPDAEATAAALRAAGLDVHIGPVVSSRRLVSGARRRALAATGALVADTETYWLATGTVPVACVRVVADGANTALYSPATLPRLRAALRVLPGVAAALTTSTLLKEAS
jgi:4-hydroxy-3-methylbut-2-en-1-yl diphosphate reductase